MSELVPRQSLDEVLAELNPVCEECGNEDEDVRLCYWCSHREHLLCRDCSFHANPCDPRGGEEG